MRAPAEALEPAGEYREAYYGSGYTNEAYNAVDFPHEPEKGYVFLTQGDNQQGIVMAERTKLIGDVALVDLDGDGVSYLSDPQYLDSPGGTSPSGAGVAAHVPSVHWPLEQMLSIPSQWDHALKHRIAFSPRIAYIGSRWVMAVPGFSNLLQTGYTPPGGLGEFANHEEHLFVRFYDMTLPSTPRNLPTLFGPSAPGGATTQTSTSQVEIMEVKDVNSHPAVTAWFAMVLDFTGKIHFYNITPIGDLANYGGPNEVINKLNDDNLIPEDPLVSWAMPKSVSDELQPNAYGIAVDQHLDENQRQRTVVYLSGFRLGIKILEFDPFDRFSDDGSWAPDGSYLQERGEIQTTHSAYRIWITATGADKKLVVPDAEAGVRVYEVAQ